MSLIKHNEYMHVAAVVSKVEKIVGFIMKNPPPAEFRWQFSVFKGSEKEALERAMRINVYPKVIV